MRKSVLFYSDWYEILRELPDDERVRAYDAIMQFAFEDIEPTDKYIKAITALIFKGIERNSVKYSQKCEKLRQNINKRWQKQKNTNEYKSIQKDTNEYNCIQTIQIDYDNVNDNVNDNAFNVAKATDKRIKEKENEIKEKEKSTAGDAFIEEYFSKQIFIDGICKELHSNPAELKSMAEAVVIEWEASGETHSDYNDAHKHMTSTLRIKAKEKRNATSKSTTERPPRPSVHHAWSEERQEWVYAF